MGKQGPCYHCGVTSTPLWRNGPPEKPVLCNACGSRWRTKGTLVNYTPLHARVEPMGLEEVKPSRLRKQPEFEPCEEGSNRSSSGSAITNSESCEIGTWDALVPSRKRTCFSRPKFSSVETLAKVLHTILHEQQYSCVSGSEEEDLLFGNASPIGHGSCLIKRRDEDSEASSQKPAFPKRDEIPHLLGNRFSPLCYINLNDIVNYEVFKKNLTSVEQEEMLKYLPMADSFESWKEIFESKQMKESLCAYQGLLSEGVFEQSFDDCDELINLALYDLSKSKWIEHYNRIKRNGRESKEVVQEGSCWLSDTSTQAEEDLLLDVPSNGSFAQAELLNPAEIFDGKRGYVYQ